MPLKTGPEYLDSIRKLKLSVNVLGEQTGAGPDHPVIAPSANAAAYTYDGAHDPASRELFTVQSTISDCTINRFTHIHSSPEQLRLKVEMLRRCGGATGCCFQRCAGMDASNSVYNTTFEIDRAHGTDYHRRFKEYHRRIQEEDLIHAAAMTDPKGDRSKRPIDQADPDLFLRVVERKSDGVVIRGAKLHQTGMVNSHEVIVMPTMALRPGEEDYAICCAIPTDSPGIHFIYGRQGSDARKLDQGNFDMGNPTFGGQEVMTVFDNVFVPEERIFLNGETEFCGPLVSRFASYHRQSYGGCKTGLSDLLIGATALTAEMNGLFNASHIRDKLVEMVHLNETMFACGIAAAVNGSMTPAGGCEADGLLANVCKLNVTRFPHEIARLATDIAGGILGTMPPAKSLDDPVVGPYVRKYMAAAEGVDPVDRMKVVRLIENMTAGAGAAAYLIESVHGAGPPQAQKVMIARQADFEAKADLVRDLLGIAK